VGGEVEVLKAGEGGRKKKRGEIKETVREERKRKRKEKGEKGKKKRKEGRGTNGTKEGKLRRKKEG